MKQLQEWQAGKYNTLVVQIRSGGVGIDMTRSCYAAYLSTGYDPLDYQQSMARLDRQGQDRPVTLYHLMVADTIDEKIHMRLEEKHRTTENLLDGNIKSFRPEVVDEAIRSFLKP
jgi:SNF2 family DNA or RNA helicase